MEPAPRTDRAMIALALVMAWFAVTAIAAGYALGSLWDLRSFELDPMDSAWRFELAWLGTEGTWSGRDIHYPRGPAWQAVATLASWIASGAWGGTLGTLHALFSVATIVMVAGLVVRCVPSRWGRVLAFFALALLTNTAGVATFRAFLPVVAIVLYLPAREADERPWRSAFYAAGVTVFAALVSFDRFGMIGLSIAALALADLTTRALWRRQPARAVMRAGRYGAALVVCAVAAGLVLLPFGFNLIDYVEGQRALMADYVVNMSVGWEVVVPVANIRALFAVLALLAVAPMLKRDQPRDRAHVELAWLAGALPAVLFATVRSDEGHMIIAMTPALTILVLVAAGSVSGTPLARRLVLGVVGAVAIVGWLGVYPRAIAGNPDSIYKAYLIATGQSGPDPAYRTDLGAARGFVRARRGEMSCLAVAADLSVLHAVTRIHGPTELSLRWSPDLKRRLADRITEADCPYFLYSVRNFDEPGHSWPFGVDFLEVVTRYEALERLGGRVVAMRRREEPLSVEVAHVGGENRVVLPVPGRAELPLGEAIDGTDLLRLQARLGMPTWHGYVGSSPNIEWRFETEDGAAVTSWRRLFHLAVDRDTTVWVSPDPEAAEWRWITGREPVRRRHPTRLAFRAEPRGVLGPSEVVIEVMSVERMAPPTPPADRPQQCSEDVDLLEPLRAGDAFARWVSPSPSERHFHLEPQPADEPLAEVLFPVTPCVDTCFRARVAVRGSAERSDGVLFDVNVIEAEQRPRALRAFIPPGGEEIPIEISLAPWADREVLLRLGTLFGEERAHDDAIVVEPRLEQCSARGTLADALRASSATVSRGSAGVAEQDAIRVAATGAEIRWPIVSVEGTCMSFGTSPDGEGSAMRLTWRVADGDVEHVLFETEVVAGQGEVAIPERALFDWTERRVEVVWELTPVSGRAGVPVILHRVRGYTCGQG